MKTIFKILAIGCMTTGCRIFFQLLMPERAQSVLQPSFFVKQGLLPLAFTLIAILAYSLFAGFFLLVKNNIPGRIRQQGLTYAFVLSLLWSVYLFEPLPHATSLFLDSLAYVVADSLSFIIMGLLLGYFFKSTEKSYENEKLSRLFVNPRLVMPIVCFVLGRIILYQVFRIYSDYARQTGKTMIWCLVVGFVSSLVLIWLQQHTCSIKNALLIYAVNLIFFNGFMLLVFEFPMVDLLLRTSMDILTISVGSCLMNRLAYH